MRNRPREGQLKYSILKIRQKNEITTISDAIRKSKCRLFFLFCVHKFLLPKVSRYSTDSTNFSSLTSHNYEKTTSVLIFGRKNKKRL